ncbi:MAG TPA: hypothetical protein DCM41_06025 [Synergistaceae bacterium]|nr:hypothetical protein [Synergistaceae bacterium]
MQKGGVRLEKKETHNEEQKTQIQIRELGSRLKSIREAQGLSIADVSNVTKIQKHYLAAIEEGDLDHLPRGPYVRSFVRQYCEHLSAPDIWKSYDVITKRQKAAEPPIPAGDETNYSDSCKVFKPRSFLWLYLLIALSLGSAGWITWQYRGDIKTSATSPIDGGTTGTSMEQKPEIQKTPLSADEAVPPLSGDAVSKDEQTDLSWMDGKQPQPVTAAAKAPDPQEAPEQAAAPRSVKVTAENAYVWMKISRGDKILFEGTMKPGEFKEYEVSSGLPVRVRIGKPGSTSILWEGKKIFPVGPGSSPATKFFWPDGKISDS